jgi:diguanylate cyclase (GGDEF)-like protein
MASTDVLTGLPNRRAFERALTHRLAHAARAGYAVCIIAIDLDHFKDVNDALGHAAGDRALCELVRAWRRELRATDVLGRCDGDAFAVLLPASNGEDAFKVVGRLLRVGGRPFSAGVAECLPGDTAERALERAERACARAKQVGRGRAILADVS